MSQNKSVLYYEVIDIYDDSNTYKETKDHITEKEEPKIKNIDKPVSNGALSLSSSEVNDIYNIFNDIEDDNSAQIDKLDDIVNEAEVKFSNISEEVPQAKIEEPKIEVEKESLSNSEDDNSTQIDKFDDIVSEPDVEQENLSNSEDDFNSLDQFNDQINIDNKDSFDPFSEIDTPNSLNNYFTNDKIKKEVDSLDKDEIDRELNNINREISKDMENSSSNKIINMDNKSIK